MTRGRPKHEIKGGGIGRIGGGSRCRGWLAWTGKCYVGYYARCFGGGGGIGVGCGCPDFLVPYLMERGVHLRECVRVCMLCVVFVSVTCACPLLIDARVGTLDWCLKRRLAAWCSSRGDRGWDGEKWKLKRCWG